jgi:peptide/nickel transport system substrate-binding protein
MARARNPDRPTMAAWVPVTRVSDPAFTRRRNRFYIGVDKDGNQLPYIESCASPISLINKR